MSERIRTLMSELKAGLQAIYRERLRGVYLYGSYARDDADEESDVDVLVVLDNFEHYGVEVNRTSELGASLSLHYGVSVSKVFLRERDWLNGQTPFLANVREEAIPA